MIDVDIAKLNSAIETLRGLLKEGRNGADIWDPDTGLVLAGYNSQPEASALFNQMTTEINDVLSGASFPELNRYYLLDLKANNLAVIQVHDGMMSGMLLDSTKVNLGVLISVAIPKYAAAIADAINH